MTGSVPEWLQALWRLDPELAKIAKHDRDAIIEARYVAVSEVSKMGRKLGMIQAQRDELLGVVKYTRQVLPRDIWANDLRIMLDTAISNAQKYDQGAANKS